MHGNCILIKENCYDTVREIILSHVKIVHAEHYALDKLNALLDMHLCNSLIALARKSFRVGDGTRSFTFLSLTMTSHQTNVEQRVTFPSDGVSNRKTRKLTREALYEC